MFSKSILVTAFAALAYAQSSVLSFTRVPNPITAGEATAITYATNDTASPVTIILRKGPSGNLNTIATLTESATGGQYIWTPSTSLENGVNYALQITQGTQSNYYGPFQLQGGGMGGGSSSSSSSSSASGYSSSSTTSSSGIIASNMTMTTSHASMGTGMTMPRNTTMSSATLSNTRAPTPTTSDDAGFQETSSGSGSAQETGAASMVGASSLALVFGAAAAVLMG